MKRFVAFCVALGCLGLQPGLPAETLPDPGRMGPYPVGVTTTVLVDESRTDPVTQKPRTLVTEIWYPATDAASGMPRNRYSEFIPGGITEELDRLLRLTYRMSAEELDSVFRNEAVRDAPVRPGKYPLIVFSHGNGGMRHQNTFWCDHLASHGYILVSADHTGNARMTILDGQIVPYQSSQRANSAVDRPRDMIFLLDAMTRWNEGADSRFAGTIDVGAAAATGMSFGSYSAFRVVDSEPRFKAVIGMAGALAEHTNLTIPALAMLGTEDRTIGPNGNAGVRGYHQKHQGPAFLFELVRGGHYSFTDVYKLNPNFGDGVGPGKQRDTGEPFQYASMELAYESINAVSTAFCGVYLKGQKEYLPFLLRNHWPEDLVWIVRNVPGAPQTTTGR